MSLKLIDLGTATCRPSIGYLSVGLPAPQEITDFLNPFRMSRSDAVWTRGRLLTIGMFRTEHSKGQKDVTSGNGNAQY